MREHQILSMTQDDGWTSEDDDDYSYHPGDAIDDTECIEFLDAGRYEGGHVDVELYNQAEIIDYCQAQ